MVIRVDRTFAAERRVCNLAAPIRYDLVDIHIELGAASSHPDMQREHFAMFAGQNFIADLGDQRQRPVINAATGMVGGGGGALDDSIGSDHLARDEILADVEMLQ